jgi:hypothetical protein
MHPRFIPPKAVTPHLMHLEGTRWVPERPGVAAVTLHQALYEEDGDMPGGKTKYRRFTQLVNAENPIYLYKYAEGSRDLDMVAPAICGKGYIVTHLGDGMQNLVRSCTIWWVLTQAVLSGCTASAMHLSPFTTHMIAIHPPLWCYRIVQLVKLVSCNKLGSNCFRGTAHAGTKQTAICHKHQQTANTDPTVQCTECCSCCCCHCAQGCP